MSPVISTFPVYNNVLLIADNTTRLLLGIDLNASFAAKRAVIIFTVPMGYLHVTAMAAADWNGKTVWLAANYLYTRKTYVIDPDKALNKGSLLGGVDGPLYECRVPVRYNLYSGNSNGIQQISFG